jgi:hypothetical protein
MLQILKVFLYFLLKFLLLLVEEEVEVTWAEVAEAAVLFIIQHSQYDLEPVFSVP